MLLDKFFANLQQLAKEENLWDVENDERVFVVPAFEMESGHPIPESKSALIQGVAAELVRPFHNETCYNCHKSENYAKWKSLPSADQGLQISFEGVWNPNWEPFYIGRRRLATF